MTINAVTWKAIATRLAGLGLLLFAAVGSSYGAIGKIDLNGDGRADILWHNNTSGASSVWIMNGTTITSGASLMTDPNWAIIASADFNGDGKSDLLWYNATTQTTTLWLMNGTTILKSAVLTTTPGWKVKSTADFNGDGKADIVWEIEATGTTVIWLMNGTVATSASSVLTDPNWRVTGTADLNGDGKADLIFRNASTGATSAWLMNGTSYTSAAVLLNDANWQIAAAVDFNGDGKADLLWTNVATGAKSIWIMNGTTPIAFATILIDANWKVVATPDLNGDHKADILWRNSVTGATSAWIMDGLSRVSGATLVVDSNWEVAGTLDLNGDGKSDLIWHNTASGAKSVWLMNGAAYSAVARLPVDATWNTVPLPGSVLVQAGRHFLYAIDENQQAVISYAIDSQSGAIAPVQKGSVPTAPQGFKIIKDQSARFAYVPNLNSGGTDTLWGYSINGNTGSLSPLNGSPFALGKLPFDVVAHPNANFLYVETYEASVFEVTAYAVNTISGALQKVPNSNGTLRNLYYGKLKISADGKFAYLLDTGSRLWVFAISGRTGALTPIPGLLSTPCSASEISVHPNGRFVYLACSGDSTIHGYYINQGTGALAEMSGSPFATPGFWRIGSAPLSLAPDGKFAYITASSGRDIIAGFRVDQITGALSPLSDGIAYVEMGPYSWGRIQYNSSGHCMIVDGLDQFNSASGLMSFKFDKVLGTLQMASNASAQGFDFSTTAEIDTFDPTGRFLYGSMPTSFGFGIPGVSIDDATCKFKQIPGAPFKPGGFGMMVN